MRLWAGDTSADYPPVLQKYLFPHLQPPNQTILESDRDALTAKYDEVAAMLSQLDAEQKAIKTGLETQRENVDAELKKVESALEEVRLGEKQRKEEMDRVRTEVETIKREMPKLFESSSQATSSSLAELQTELKSLRSLLVSRQAINAGSSGVATNGSSLPASSSTPALNGTSSPLYRYGSPSHNQNNNNAATSSGSNSPPTATIPTSVPPLFGVGSSSGKPSIPSWQLADSTTNGSSSSGEEPAGTSAAQAGKEHSSAVANGSGSGSGSADEAEKEGYVV